MLERFKMAIATSLLREVGTVVTINSQSIRVYARDENSKVTRCSGTVTISGGGSGYAKGCQYVKTDAATGVDGMYENIGTTSSCTFVQVDAVTPGEIALANTHIMVGNASAVATDVAMSGDATISNTGVITVAAAAGAFSVGTDLTFAKEVNHIVSVATSTTANVAGGTLTDVAGAGNGTGAGGAYEAKGGASGAGATGNGGAAKLTGGAAASTNGSGGSAVLSGGAKTGTGIAGGVRVLSQLIRVQPTPAAKTVSATLTATELLTGLITIAQGAGAASAQQLPTGSAIVAALPADFATGESFEVAIVNTSTVDAEDASVTTNTDLTLVGNMDFQAHSSLAAQGSSGKLRIVKTGATTFNVYRVS